MKYTIVLILFVLVGCKSIQISEVNKTLIKKGNPMGLDYIEYNISISSEKDFYIEDIFIEDDDTKLNYYYKDLKTGLSSYKMLSPFIKGNYSFHFKLEDISRMSKKESLVIKMKVDNKIITKKEFITKRNKSILTK